MMRGPVTFVSAAVVACALLAGCGGSPSTEATIPVTTKGAAPACPVLADAVSQGAIFKNALDIPITLRAENTCGSIDRQVFSGDRGPAQIDGLQLAPGSSVDVGFEGKPGLRMPFDLNPDVAGGMRQQLPWSVQLGFGATSGQGAIFGWDEGYERYVSGPDLETFTTNDGVRIAVSVIDGVVTFAPPE